MDDILDNNDLRNLVNLLPEIYQPIYNHPELTTTVSRQCQDRLSAITDIYKALENNLQRPLRVLDLGCAQGFFSLNLAKLGATVHGVDFFEGNIAVCNALSAEHPDFNISFKTERIEDTIQGLQPNQYDLVLGLSIFHHVIYERGIHLVKNLINKLAETTNCAIFELALASEPIYWATAQPQNPYELLEGFAFVHEVARYETHLSSVKRPLYFASNRYWYLDKKLGKFETWKEESHAFSLGCHQKTRRYYFGNDLVIKLYNLNNKDLLEPNINEYKNEVEFFRSLIPGFKSPQLVLHGMNDHEAWLVEEKLPGELMLDIIRAGKPYDAKQILHDILEQLVALESCGLYHRDVRAWNIIIDTDGHARLIDYGSIIKERKDCDWPGDIFLAFMIFIYEVTTGQIEPPNPLRTAAISPYRLEQPYRQWIQTFWSYSSNEWSFKLLYDLFLKINENDTDVVSDRIVSNTWIKAVEEAIDAQTTFMRYIKWQQEKTLNDLNTFKIAAYKDKDYLIDQIDNIEMKLTELAKTIQCIQDSYKDLDFERERELLIYKLRANMTIVDNLNNELQSVYASRSWRYTKPLRMGKRWLKNAVGLPKWTAKTTLIKAMQWTFRHPILAERLKPCLNRFPKFKSRLKGLLWAGKTGEDNLIIDSAVPLAQELSPMTRKIYFDLKKAIEERK